MSQREKVYQMLKDRGEYGVYNYEFIRLDPPILRAASRVDELRSVGMDVECKRIRKGVFKYILKEREPIIKKRGIPKQSGLF